MKTPFTLFSSLFLSLLLAFFAIYPSPLLGVQIKNKLTSAKVGSYAVIKHHRHCTLIHLQSRESTHLLFEEITIPIHQLPNWEQTQQGHWKEWVCQGAPGHTSWILYTFDLEKNAITRCFSITENTYLETKHLNSLLATLFTLDLTPLSQKKQLQKRATQLAGQVEKTAPWSPPKYHEGKRCKNPKYEVFQTKWPTDGSPLGGNLLTIYFDRENPSFPFPYWMQLRKGGIKWKMHVVDSGKHLGAPKKHFPKIQPTFLSLDPSSNNHLKGGLECTLHVPFYYQTIALYAIDTTVSPRKMTLVPATLSRSQEKVTLLVDSETLSSLLEKNHRYIWIAIPDEEPFYAEWPHLFTYVPPREEK